MWNKTDPEESFRNKVIWVAAGVVAAALIGVGVYYRFHGPQHAPVSTPVPAPAPALSSAPTPLPSAPAPAIRHPSPAQAAPVSAKPIFTRRTEIVQGSTDGMTSLRKTCIRVAPSE